jgi:hypothetical protein
MIDERVALTVGSTSRAKGDFQTDMLGAAEKVRYEVPAQPEQNGRGSGAQSLPENDPSV